jgi:hypothetical protein
VARHWPELTATPLPPRNPLHRGQQCPTTAAVPARLAPAAPARWPPVTQASAPLAMSATSTAEPQTFPRAAMALAAPGLPLPVTRRSVAPPDASRAATSAAGTVPRRYPATPAATRPAGELLGAC